jgi:subtilase family serine protease
MDDHNHGTHVAGTIGAVGNNAAGVVGVNWLTSLMGLKFLDSSGSGTTADAIDAIDFAMQVKQIFAASGGANIRILSNSWGGGDFSQALLDAINEAADDDMLFVAAAGNNGLPNDWIPMYPASYAAANIIAVAATTNTDARAFFSNYGAKTVHLGAPGADILSTLRGGTYGFQSGTSMATPHVSGAAALTLAHCVLNTASLKTALLDAVDPVPSLSTTTITGGRLNVRKTMAGCSEPPGVPTNLVANAGNQQIRLTWSPAPNATSYRVRRSTTPGGPYTDAASNVRDVQFTNTGLTNGTTYYYVVTAMNILGESAPSVEVSATPKLPADMIVSAFSVPATAPTGGSISISLTTKNQGTGTADPSTTRFYISLNSALDAADSVIPNAAQAVPALAPGLTAAASVTITLPSTVLPGTYYVIAKADADDKVFETLETNNTYGLRISIGPDLSIWSFQPQGTGAPGATVTASYYIRNQGVEGTGASVLEIFWSANNSLDAGDTPVGRTDIGALLPNGVQSGQVPFVVPAGAAQGTYYLFAMADSSNAINESSESNNTRSASIQIGADLISRVSAPSMPGSGIPFVVTDTTTNAGTHSVGLSATRFYLSSNSTLSADDTLLGSRPVGVLEPGQASVGNTTVTIPAATTGGSYFLISQADGANAVVETNETNNTHAQAISVGPDLKVTVSSTTWPVTAGTAALVTDTVRNAGGNEAAASILRYYLSVNSWLDAGDVTLVESRSIGVLGPDASTTAQTSVTIPAGTAPGYYYLIAVADADGSVAESVEWNNTNVKLMLVK